MVQRFSLGKLFRAKAMLTGKVEKRHAEVGKNHNYSMDCCKEI